MRLLPTQPGDPVAVAGLPVLGRLARSADGIAAGSAGGGQIGGDQLTDALLAGNPDHPEGAVVVHRVRPDIPDILELRWVLREMLPTLATRPLPGVGLLTWDVDAERPWWARRFVPGASLADRVGASGPLAASELVSLSTQLSAELGRLHAAGVVHGGLRPSRVILGARGPQLVDLELVLAEQRYGRLSDPRADPWAAPEAVAGQAIGPQADVYGLGCLIGYAATGVLPLSDDPDTALPPWLAGVVHRSANADPQARPAITDFAGWSGQVAGPGPAGAAPAPARGAGPGSSRPVAGPPVPGPFPANAPAHGAARRSRRTLALAAVAGVGTLALVLGAWAVLGGRNGAPPAATPAAVAGSGAAHAPPDDIVAAAPVPIDATGRWNGSAAEVEGDAVYEMAVELAGDAQYPRGTVSMTNIATGSTAAWEVSGRWQAKQLVLEPGPWLARPDRTWKRSVLTLVALTQGRLTGITAPPDAPGDPTSNVDLFR